MRQTVEKYAVMLRKLGIPADVLGQTKDIFEAVPQILSDFSNPANGLSGKHRVIDRVFPMEIRDFLKLLCDDNEILLFPDICKAYTELIPENREKICAKASLYDTTHRRTNGKIPSVCLQTVRETGCGTDRRTG